MKPVIKKTELQDKMDNLRNTLYLNPVAIIVDSEILELEALIQKYVDSLDYGSVWKNRFSSIIASLDEVRNRDSSYFRSKTVLAILDEFQNIRSSAYYDEIDKKRFRVNSDLIGYTYNDDFMPEARRKMQRSIRLEEYANKQPKKDYSNWGVDNGKPVILDFNDAEEAKTSKEIIDKVTESIKKCTLLMSNEEYSTPNGLALLATDMVVLIKKEIKKYDNNIMRYIIYKYTHASRIKQEDVRYLTILFVFDIGKLIDTFE